MKRNIVLLTLFIAFATAITGQNAHWEYQFSSSGNPVAPTSAVIVNSFGKIYLFQTDPAGIYVSLIDHSTMQPVAIDYELLQGYDFLLEGGYGDFNGNIVVYGSVDVGGVPVPISGRYDVSSHAFTSYFLDSAHPDDHFINGCCGYDINGNGVNMLVLENTGQLVCVDWDHNSIDSLKITNFNGKISDVVWDAGNLRFAVAGSQESGYEQLFLLEVQYNINSGFILQNTLAWYVDPSYNYGERRTCLEIISDSEIIVGHCARTQQADGVWLSIVNSYTTVTNSVFFDMPSQKLFLLDMKYDDTRNQLALLFEMLHFCGRVNIIAQVDPHSLSSMSAAEVRNNISPTPPCAYNPDPLYDNEIYLKKLELNYMPWSCARILASGVNKTGYFGQDDAFVTETYKIAYSQCDYVFSPMETGASYTYSTASCLNSYHNYVYPPVFSPIPNPGSLNGYWSCPDLMPCSKGVVESPKRLINEGNNVAKLEFEIDGTLVFQSFSGEIFYGVYNALGQLVLSGHTFNENLWLDLPKAGFYVVKAEDKSGNVATKKIIVTR